MDLGRYRLVERIGQGGMATVWLAEDRQLGRRVAIKRLLPFVAERGDGAERFEREARALAGIRHPNVLQLFDYLPDEGDEPARLVMELLSGPSLHRFVVEHGAPLPEVAALVAAEIAAGLVAVHSRGIVHRDVKPENILIDEGRVVLTDFGIARVAVHDRSALTQTGAIIGSPSYMSPEQARGDEVGAASDQFALGSLLYFLCTGAAPFVGPHPLVVMQRIERCEYLPIGTKNPRVPAWLERVIKKCLQREPSARYVDMGALELALRRGLSDDSLADPALELRRYFADRAAYNAELDDRLVRVRLGVAETALERGDRARALVAVGGVLQVDAHHPRALELLSLLSRTPRRRAALLAGAVLASAVAASLFVRPWLATRTAPPPLEPPRPAPLAMRPPLPVVDAGVSVASQPRATGKVPSAVRPTRVSLAAPDRAAVAIEPVDPPAVAPIAVPASPPPSKAELFVRTAPWCRLAVDGRDVGSTPQHVTLEPGRHVMRCVSASGAVLDREIDLAPGERHAIEERLFASVPLVPQLSRGDAVRIDEGGASADGRKVSAGRHRVTLLRGGQELEARWLDVAERGCRLLDKPELRCEVP